MPNTQAAPAASAESAQDAHIKRAGMQDKLATGVLTAIVALVMLLVVSMIAYILFQGIGTLFKPGFLTEAARANGTEGGVAYQLFDSFYMLFLTLIISVPISLGGAVFLVEYAPDGPITTIASTAIETLSSLPSIVVGMFGFLVFSVNLGWKYSIISGAVALTMFNIPILVRVIQQALEDVPQSQRDACAGHGPNPLGGYHPRADPRRHARHRHRHRAVRWPRVRRGRRAVVHLRHVQPRAPQLRDP